MKSPPPERRDIPAIARLLEFCRVREVAPKTMIIRAAQIPDTLYYLLDGSVEVIIEDESGKEMILAYLNPGHFFGEMGFFQDDSVRSAWVRSRTTCRIAEMNYATFAKLAAERPQIVFEMATQLALRLARTNSKVSDLAFLDVTGRVAHALIDLSQEPDARQAPGGRLVAVTRPQLARLVGCSREMVSKVLKVMHGQGLIRDGGDGILVRDEPVSG